MSELNDVYKLRLELERSFTDSLLAATETKVLNRENKSEAFQNTRPRYELKCMIGAATGHRNICPDGYARYDCFRFSLAIQAVTAVNKDTPTLNEDLQAKARAWSSNLHALSVADTTNFPNVWLAVPLRESGTDSTLSVKDNVEYSTVSFQGIVQIRPTSWPQQT